MIEYLITFINSNLISLLGIIFSEVLLILLFMTWVKNSWWGSLPSYDAIQKIHKGEISRLGGFAAFVTISMAIIYRPLIDLDHLILITFVPILLVTLFEDMNLHLNPNYRLLAMILACGTYFFFNHSALPIINFPVIGDILNHPFIAPLFFSLALIALMNGCNFIDGANGLLISTLIVSFSSLLALEFYVADNFTHTNHLLLPILMLLILLLFNYPLGKIFMGDVGAYFFGWLLGLSVIEFYGKHPEIPSWSAVLILFYPVTEVSFSVIRKIVQNKSPFLPDAEHLHLKIFFFFKKHTGQVRTANNLVMPIMTFFWLVPPLFAVLFQDNLPLILMGVFLSVFIYTALYIYFPKNTD